MFKRFIGIFLIAVVIKIMDDFLDKDIDKLSNQWNITLILKRAILPYCIVLLILSLYCNFNESVSIFAASYMLGMINEHNQQLPTRLYAWQEGLLMILFAIYMTSVKDVFSALVIVSFIQIIDDVIDLNKDKYTKVDNTIYKYGKINMLIISIILLLISIRYFLIKTIYYLLAGLTLYTTFFLLKKKYRDDKYVY